MKKYIPLCTAAAMALAGISVNAADQPAKKPNILWIMTDEQNTLTMQSYDDNNYTHLGDSPNLDRMAAEGTLFMNQFVQCPQCVATRTSMITGLYPHQSGVLNNNACLVNWKYNYNTIPEVFTANGYNTANVGKIHYPNGREIWGYNDTHYAYYESKYVDATTLRGTFAGQNEQWSVLKPTGYNLILSGIYPTPIDGDTYPETALTNKAINWLENHKDSEKPFLLRVSYLSPHAPFLAPLPFYDKYTPDQMAGWDRPTSSTLNGMPSYEKSKSFSFSEEVIRRVNATYYGLANHVDDEVGRIDAYLKASGLDQNTLVLFTSDHGHFNGEYNLYGKGEFYDLATRVPTFIKGPGIPAGQKAEYFTEDIDLGRTFMEYAGITPPEQFTRSAKNMLSDTQRNEVIGEIVLGGERRSWIRTKDYSMDYTYMNFRGCFPNDVVNDDPIWRTKTWSAKDGKLIDLKRDPLFHNNVYYDLLYGKVREQLQAKLETRLAVSSVPAWSIFTNAQIASSKPKPSVNPEDVTEKGYTLDFTNLPVPMKLADGTLITKYREFIGKAVTGTTIVTPNTTNPGSIPMGQFATSGVETGLLLDDATKNLAYLWKFNFRNDGTKGGFLIVKNPNDQNEDALGINVINNTLRYGMSSWSIDPNGGLVTGLYASKELGWKKASVKIGNYGHKDYTRRIKMSITLANAISYTKSQAIAQIGQEVVRFDPANYHIYIRKDDNTALFDTGITYNRSQMYELSFVTNRYQDEAGNARITITYYLDGNLIGSGDYLGTPTAQFATHYTHMFISAETDEVVAGPRWSPCDMYIDDYNISVAYPPSTDPVKIEWSGLYEDNGSICWNLGENKAAKYQASFSGTGKAEQMVMIAASYDKNNKLLDVSTKIVDVAGDAKNQNEELQIDISVDTTRVNTMLFNSFGSLNPIYCKTFN